MTDLRTMSLEALATELVNVQTATVYRREEFDAILAEMRRRDDAMRALVKAAEAAVGYGLDVAMREGLRSALAEYKE